MMMHAQGFNVLYLGGFTHADLTFAESCRESLYAAVISARSAFRAMAQTSKKKFVMDQRE
jgi:hypothetical protein